MPIRMNRLTDEDADVTDPKERERRFGQHDHVRFYGCDFEDRLRDAGFHVAVIHATDILDSSQIDQTRISSNELLFYCQKLDSSKRN